MNMKIELLVGVCLIACAATSARSEYFKTLEGKQFKNATITRVEPDGIVVITKYGVSKIYFAELPEEIQRRFHYDAQKAASYTAEESEKTAALERQRLAESQSRAEERAKYCSERAATVQSQNGSLTNGSAE